MTDAYVDAVLKAADEVIRQLAIAPVSERLTGHRQNGAGKCASWTRPRLVEMT
jgi:hypothetical protein